MPILNRDKMAKLQALILAPGLGPSPYRVGITPGLFHSTQLVTFCPTSLMKNLTVIYRGCQSLDISLPNVGVGNLQGTIMKWRVKFVT